MIETKPKKLIGSIIYDILGTAVYAAGIHCFIRPVNIAPGGISGIAIMLNFLFALPIGLVGFVLNIPLLMLSWRYLGRDFTVRTLRTLAVNTLMYDAVISRLLPEFSGDRLLGSVFGGLLVGTGLGIIFMHGSTTGGVDIVSYLIGRKRPHLPVGRILLLADFSVIAASMPIYGDVEAGLYGIISAFCSSMVIDKLVYGADRGSIVTVISKKCPEIAGSIISELGRSATIIGARGAYSGNPTEVLICAVRRHQTGELRGIISRADSSAFVIVSEAGEILGEGFKSG